MPAHPFLYGPMDRAFEHERRYARRALGSLLRETGYEVAELRVVNPVGALGWFVTGKILRRDEIPGGPLAAYDRLVPVFRLLDRLELPWGLSLWSVARRPG